MNIVRILGVSIAAEGLRMVVLVKEHGAATVEARRKLSAPSDSRAPDELRALQTVVSAVLDELRPDFVAIRQNPEGLRRSSSGTLRMEAVLLLQLQVPVKYVSPQAIKKQAANLSGEKVWHDAFGAALHALG